MILEQGDMWSAFGKGIFAITTNPIVRKDGAVVMGAGIALEAKTRYPSLPYDFAKQLAKGYHEIGYIGTYDEVFVWWFMVKEHWIAPANPDIIKKSVHRLVQHSEAIGNRQRIDLNFPGIGNGKLRREDVLPLIARLPDNVHIWEKA